MYIRNVPGLGQNPALVSNARLANRIVKHSNITLSKTHPSAEGKREGILATAYQNIVDTSAGLPASLSKYGNAPGGTVQLDRRMLEAILALANKYRIVISELAGASHSPKSRHYAGLAMDIVSVDGVPVNKSNPHVTHLMGDCKRLGATEVLGPGDKGHATHIHCAWPRTQGQSRSTPSTVTAIPPATQVCAPFIGPRTTEQLAIELFGGCITPPSRFPRTRQGFQAYLDATGVKHFSAAEMIKPHDTQIARKLGYGDLLPQQEWWPRGAALAKIADRIRSLIGAPISMRNWWRPANYNQAVGGAKLSEHIDALAIDLDYHSVADRETAEGLLREFQRQLPWLGIRLGLGNLTTHVGILFVPSTSRPRIYYYKSYPKSRTRHAGS